MQNIKKYFMTLALLLTAVTGAWATDYTTLAVGDVIKVGDTFSPTADGALNENGVAFGKTYTLMRADVDNDYNVTEKTDGAYYVFKFVSDMLPYIHFEKTFAVTAISDGLEVTNIENMKGMLIYTLALHESAAPSGPEVTWDAVTKTGFFTMPASNIELQVEYEPTKVTMAVNDKTMGTAEVAGESKVEWTADTWKGWTYNTKEYTVDDITMTSSQNAYIQEYTKEGMYKNSLDFFVDKWDNSSNVTFSTTGAPFSRIEFTMLDAYEADWNPNIMPLDNWTFEGKSAVWEGEATKSLTLQSCTTSVSKITFFKGDIPDGVTVNGDGTFTVAKTATVTLKATPAEGYKFLYWEDDQTNTNPVREVTIESGMADMTYKAVFAEILYNITFAEGTNPDPENPEWTATPNPAKTKQTVTVTYSGPRKVMGVKAEKKGAAGIVNPVVGQIIGSDGNNYDANATLPTGVTAVAKICYVGSETGVEGYTHGLALALTDKGQMSWTDATGASGAAAHTPAAPTTTSSWMLPSKDQWDKMINAAGGYTALRNGFIGISGAINLMSVNYWSSTEEGPSKAWRYYFANGSWTNKDKSLSNVIVRACLAF